MSDDSKRPPLSRASGTTATDHLKIKTAGPRLAIFSQDQSPGVVPRAMGDARCASSIATSTIERARIGPTPRR
jgi:hypothetical protein